MLESRDGAVETRGSLWGIHGRPLRLTRSATSSGEAASACVLESRDGAVETRGSLWGIHGAHVASLHTGGPGLGVLPPVAAGNLHSRAVYFTVL